MSVTQPLTKTLCYHCGDECRNDAILSNGKHFCCDGCKLVHELLEENNLCTYYQLTEHPGNKPNEIHNNKRFGWLDDEQVSKQLLTFSEGNTAVVSFNIPKIHCASCIWLLENLHKMQKGILSTRVNFLAKNVTITFDRQFVSLRRVVELLHQIGYEPDIHFNDLQKKVAKKIDRNLIFKIGVAGFCFGNIMMLSFPEYFSGINHIEPELKHFFSYLNLIIALPVFFYSANDYFISSLKAARQKYFSIDLPIALGLTAMLIRSSYEILSGSGAGYFDSMTGLVFFLLTGRFFQSLTYKSMSFERNYQSYFPVAVAVKKNGEVNYKPISQVNAGDKIVIHSEELVPADALLLSGTAQIDYSFVTGESAPMKKNPGELIYAGGKQKGSSIELQVQKTVEQSYLTQLWNHESFQKEKHERLSKLADTISKYFTIAIILVAVATAFYWFPKDIHRGILSCTAILIIACPCALAITVPFTFGNIIRILGRNHFYLKNANVVESISKIDTIVFDKTGTLTQQNTERIHWEGTMLTGYQWKLIKSVASQSIHPLSKLIAGYAVADKILKVENFTEEAGRGVQGFIDEMLVKMGSKSFVKHTSSHDETGNTSRVFVSINEHYLGFFQINNVIREGLQEQVKKLSSHHEMFLVSGDNDSERETMEKIFGVIAEEVKQSPSSSVIASEAKQSPSLIKSGWGLLRRAKSAPRNDGQSESAPRNEERLFFHQSPSEKLQLISKLQNENHTVLMLGDGLNDAGALQQSDVGVAITDDLLQFSPACDVIMKGSEFNRFHSFLQFCKSGINIIWFTFGVSLLYNVVGISFAVKGNLSPMIAAILMPVSSISVILITTLATKWKAKRLGF